MENDYFKITDQEKEELDRLGITYRWRDSCLATKKQERLCKEENKWTGFWKCKDKVSEWQKCQQEREKAIVNIENLVLQPLEVRKSLN